MRIWKAISEGYATSALNSAAYDIQRRHPELLYMGDPTRPLVALTYDDGPHPRDTPALLEVLARHKVMATFSWLGERVEAYPELVRAAAAAGHRLMIHGYRHRSFLIEHRSALRAMLAETRRLLAMHSGHDPATIYAVRPPFGHLSGSLVRALCDWGYQPVIGNLIPLHWLQPAAISLRQVLTQVGPGSLIVLHESLPGPAVAELTDRMLTELRGRELRFVGLDELRSSTPLAE
jgi:peptidoglycan/xylan/chitin deacetylase (PgdA/CDA1 family)